MENKCHTSEWKANTESRAIWSEAIDVATELPSEEFDIATLEGGGKVP